MRTFDKKKNFAIIFVLSETAAPKTGGLDLSNSVEDTRQKKRKTLKRQLQESGFSDEKKTVDKIRPSLVRYKHSRG